MAKQRGGFKVGLIVLWGMAVLACSHHWNPPYRNMQAAENRALEGFAYARRPVRSRVICGRDCSMDEQCKSFNFNDCHKTCELNLATRREQLEAFKEIQGSVYLDENKDTPAYSESDTDDCTVSDGKSLYLCFSFILFIFTQRRDCEEDNEEMFSFRGGRKTPNKGKHIESGRNCKHNPLVE